MDTAVSPDTDLRSGVNPLLDPADTSAAPPCAFVVFGASGDLAGRKLLPALRRMSARRELPGRFAVVGVARTPWTDEDFRRAATVRAESAARGPDVGDDPATWRDLVAGFRYISGDYGHDNTFERLASALDEVDRIRGTDGNRVYYLAVPPIVVPTIVAALARHRLNRPGAEAADAFVRIVIEKPYGVDQQSAEDLDRCIHAVFDESQVFRIDHFLGKETVQNFLALRFANAVFEPVWNRRYVDSVQLTVAESEGVGQRSGFYEQTGALRDMVQNHLLQVLSLALLEPPSSIEPEGIRDEKVKALRAVRIPDVLQLHQTCVRGQYVEGWVAGHTVPGYRSEPGVEPSSKVETYVAMKVLVDNWRWDGVPFYLRTGKRLPKRVSEVAIQFHAAPKAPFGPDRIHALEPDALVVRIHPDEGVAMIFGTKVPGRGFDVRPVAMEFLYGSVFRGETPDPYERLLLDVLVGDPTLFIRTDEVMQAWRIVTPILEAGAKDDLPIIPYRAGTWGPSEADALIGRDGRRWRTP
jgi:glucose-6-phosphate 1-dehydrogenase